MKFFNYKKIVLVLNIFIQKLKILLKSSKKIKNTNVAKDSRIKIIYKTFTA